MNRRKEGMRSKGVKREEGKGWGGKDEEGEEKEMHGVSIHLVWQASLALFVLSRARE